jgi:hypothetical protein
MKVTYRSQWKPQVGDVFIVNNKPEALRMIIKDNSKANDKYKVIDLSTSHVLMEFASISHLEAFYEGSEPKSHQIDEIILKAK